MAARALWKGHLRIAELACPVALHAAASTSERVSMRIVNRATGNPVKRDYVDAETEEAVPAEDRVKGYEIERDRYVLLEPEELASAVPDSDKTLKVEAFLDCPDIHTTYFDKPYYLAPAGPGSAAAFALVREAMRARGVAALARAVLFRRVRTLLIRAQGPGLVANTLNFDYEVRPSAEAFRSIPEVKVEGEMLDLAKHIIKTKQGRFDPAAFEDRYEAALAEFMRAKAEGREISLPERTREPVVVDLLEALRKSAGAAGSKGKKGAASGRKSADAGKRKPDSRRGSKASDGTPRRKAS